MRRLTLLSILVLGTLPVALPAPVQAQRALGIDTTALDRGVRPQDDFNRFVNGRWIDRTEIPADRTNWGVLPEMTARNQDLLRVLSEEAAAGAPGSERRKVGDLYASFIDSAAVEARGLGPLAEELAAIRQLDALAELPALLARLQRVGVRGFAPASVNQDERRSSEYVVTVGQGPLVLGDRSFYLLQGDSYERARAGYLVYFERLFALARIADPAAAAARVLAFETRVAEIQWERERLRDPEATYNRMSRGALAALSPSFDWSAYLAAAGMGAPAEVVVGQPDYLQGTERVLTATPIGTLREYLSARLLDAYAPFLPDAFVDAQFEFRGRVLAGTQAQPPRWRRALAEVESSLGEALGRLYVARHYPPDASARMDALVRNLLAAFRTGIDGLEWMSPATREAAHAKLATFTVKIGHPEKWKDYSTLEIRRDDLIGNAMRGRTFRYEDQVRRLGGPVDRSEWLMSPQTVNAYYQPTNNEIAFPAGILQPPFFDASADDAVNYGAIGAVIGHEISHGFDDSGRKYDGVGNLTDWWTAEDARAFEARAGRLAAQYGAYLPLADLPINGQLTLGENIGDLSGLAVAYRAYRISLGGREAPVIGGFTGDQRFFMGWAQGWRQRIRDEALRRQILTDSHSPAAYRAFVPLTNLDAFHAAFDVRPGDAMYRSPEERVKIW